MSEVTYITARPRDGSTGVETVVRMAGGGADLPYYHDDDHYYAGVINRPRFTAKLGFDQNGWTGGAVPTTTPIAFMPSTPAKRDELNALYWRDAGIEIDGGPEGGTITRLLTGTVADQSVSDGQLIFTIADLAHDLNKPLIKATFAGDGGIEGPAEAEGREKRRSWGKVFNVELRLLDADNNIYEAGDPAFPLQAFVAVKDKGREGEMAIIAWQGSIAATFAALQASEPAQGGCAVAPSIACVKWWTQPAGPLTADLEGENTGGYVDTAAAIAGRIAAAVSGPALANQAEAAAWRSAEAGLHVGSAQETAAQALDRLLLGVSLLWIMEPAGLIRIREWAFDEAAPPLNGLYIGRETTLPPMKSRKLGYRKNHRIHNDGEISAAILWDTLVDRPSIFVSYPIKSEWCGTGTSAPTGLPEDVADMAETPIGGAVTIEGNSSRRGPKAVFPNYPGCRYLVAAKIAAGADHPSVRAGTRGMDSAGSNVDISVQTATKTGDGEATYLFYFSEEAGGTGADGNSYVQIAPGSKIVRFNVGGYNGGGSAEAVVSSMQVIDITKSYAAQSDAATAQAAADAAQADATASLADLADISSDSLLTPDEKPRVIQDRDVITAEQSGIDARATAYGITTEKTAYDNAVSALTSYLATLTTPVLWSLLSGNTTIVGATFRTKFKDVYAARQVLLNKIAEIAKTLADAAQAAADNAAADAATAQAAADAAQADADAANAELSDIANDGKLTADEKIASQLRYDSLIEEQGGIDAEATANGVSTEKTAYDNAITALKTYLKDTVGVLNGSYVWTGLSGTTVITRTTWNGKWSDVYAARQALLNKISSLKLIVVNWGGPEFVGVPALGPSGFPLGYRIFSEATHPETAFVRATGPIGTSDQNPYLGEDSFRINMDEGESSAFMYLAASGSQPNMPMQGGRKLLFFTHINLSNGQQLKYRIELRGSSTYASDWTTSEGGAVLEVDMSGAPDGLYYARYRFEVDSGGNFGASDSAWIYATDMFEKTGDALAVPVFMPGDWREAVKALTVEENADVTVTAGGPTTIKIARDYTGVPKTSQFPLARQFFLDKAGADVTEDADSWSVSSHTGYTFGAFTDGALSITAISSSAAEVTLTITAAFDGIDYIYQVTIVFVDDAPPTASGGDIDTATLSSPTTTSHAVISSKVMEVNVTDGTADITALLSWDYYGAFSVYLKAQYSADGSTGWTDVGSEVLGSDGSPGVPPFEPGDPGATYLSVQKTGLSSGSAFFRIQGRRENGTGTLVLRSATAQVAA